MAKKRKDQTVTERPDDIPIHEGDDVVLFAPDTTPDDATGTDDLMHDSRLGLRDGITLLRFWLARDHVRAELLAADYGLTIADLAPALNAARVLR